MTTQRWQNYERSLAALLGGQRALWNDRRWAEGIPDVRHAWLSVAVELQERFPGWLDDALARAQAVAGPSQLPIAIAHQLGGRYEQDLVVLTLGDFRSWFRPSEPFEGRAAAKTVKRQRPSCDLCGIPVKRRYYTIVEGKAAWLCLYCESQLASMDPARRELTEDEYQRVLDGGKQGDRHDNGQQGNERLAEAARWGS